jgi:GntR family transcriptional regulator
VYGQIQYDPGKPIYLQIIRHIREKIASGEWQPGDRVPPVRDLALEFGVNPNTMQRSLSELERDGLVYSERTSGRFITKDSALINKVREDMALEFVVSYISDMTLIGYTPEEIRGRLEEALQSINFSQPKEENI